MHAHTLICTHACYCQQWCWCLQNATCVKRWFICTRTYLFCYLRLCIYDLLHKKIISDVRRPLCKQQYCTCTVLIEVRFPTSAVHSVSAFRRESTFAVSSVPSLSWLFSNLSTKHTPPWHTEHCCRPTPVGSKTMKEAFFHPFICLTCILYFLSFQRHPR